MKAVLALIAVILSLFVLETARQGVNITQVAVGETPVTRYARAGADGPAVVVAHGFAGSQQMMQGYALPLAQAGYQVYAFEFLGHGRHTAPMSGDVNALDGTTRLLVAQTAAVLDTIDAGGMPVALLGHSMATDILARVAQERDDIGPLVLISAFSQVIDANFPPDLLLIAGSWEPGLRGFAQEAVQMVDPTATTGQTVMTSDLRRRVVIAPMTEHVSVLHSRAGRGEAVIWLDGFYGRQSQPSILPTGTAILGLLVGVVLLFGPIAARLPQRPVRVSVIGRQQLAIMLVVPLVLTPLIAVPLSPSFLPVLVADYLGLHLLIFGGIQLALLWWWQLRIGPIAWRAVALLLLWCALFGFLLDRYAANFIPTPQRVWIMAVLALGAVPYMLADMVLSAQSGFLRRLMVRLAFLTSLGIAVALDFEGLFFLIMIAPVLVLFYAVFGTMGRHVARRSGPAASGLVLGLVLAWALGVSFPLFVGT
ncbi:alpha/beta hydrolase [Yoonia algicola]|uniref:Alpha/beta fold hydrolase n=1 Tax=Yoonia algicola TaxID=3137368 RepID=A0AAN0M0S8_9RHOB